MIRCVNHVTKDMVASIRAKPMFNSDTVRKTVGLWRYQDGGVVHEGVYDYDTEMIGVYRVPEFYGYVQKYYSIKGTPQTYLLYYHLLRSDRALAVFFVNNTYVCRILPDRVEYFDGLVLKDVFMLDDIVMSGICPVDVGWIKTKLKCFIVESMPWKFHMNLFTDEVYTPNRGWFKLDFEPMIQQTNNYEMYKKLLKNPDAEAVCMDIAGELHFI